MGWMRLILALSVVAGHSHLDIHLPLIDAGAAVMGFYVISGYFMAMVLETRYGNARRTFYWNRFIRIWPAYIAVILTTFIFLAWWAVRPEGKLYEPFLYFIMYGAHAALSTRLAYFFSQVFILGQDWSHFFVINAGGKLELAPDSYFATNCLWRLNLIPQAWSLAVEETFYLLAPLFALRWKSKTLGFLFVSALALRAYAELSGFAEMHPWARRNSLLDMPVFFGGILAWRFRKALLLKWPGVLGHWAPAVALILFPLACPTPWLQRLLLPAGVLLLILKMRFDRAESGWSRLCGELSYPVYLVHMLVFWALILMSGNVAWTIPLTLLAAAALHFLVERPARRFKAVMKHE